MKLGTPESTGPQATDLPADGAARSGRFLAPAALAGLVALVFNEPLRGAAFFFRDLYLISLPRRTFVAAALRDGRFPLWDPELHGGLPALGPQLAPFHPSTVLYAMLDPATALTVVLVGHVLLAALFAFALARSLGLRPAGAFVAGAAFALSGYTLSAANLYQPLLALPWVAGGVLGFRVFLLKGRPWGLALAAAGVGMPLLSASAETALVSAVAIFLEAIVTPRAGGLRRRLGACLAAGMLGGCLGAPQVLPALEMARESARGHGLSWESFTAWSVAPARLPELVVPGALGPTGTLRDEDYWGRAIENEGFPFVLSITFGASVLALAFAGALGAGTPGRRHRIAFASLAVAAVLLALGRHLPGFHLLYETVPWVRTFRYPVKALAAAVLPVALLAGAGLEAVLRGGAGTRRVAAAAFGLSAVSFGFAAFAWGRGLPGIEAAERALFRLLLTPEQRGQLATSVLHAAAVLALAALLVELARRRGGAWAPVALAAIVGADVAVAGARVNVFAPRSILERPALAGIAGSASGGGRLFRDADRRPFVVRAPTNDVAWLVKANVQALRFYSASAYRIPVLFHDDYDGLAPARVRALGEVVRASGWTERLEIFRAAGVAAVVTRAAISVPGYLHAGGVVDAGGPVYVYRVEGTRRARFASTAVLAADAASARDHLRRRSGRGEVVLEGTASPGGACGEAPALVRDAGPEMAVVEVEAPCDGWLVLADPFYPGWEASLDGRAAEILPADSAFRAVAVSRGRHVVEFRYRPRTLLPGLAGAALAALVLAAYAARTAARSRRRPIATEDGRPRGRESG
mgnify:CR=1 FL=1